MPTFDLRPCSIEDVDALCGLHHGYGGAGGLATYAFGVYEGDRIVAAYSWQPPPPGAAKSACPEAPHAVLSLSRMVAVPKEDRALKHISKPLRLQMKNIIDRGRWPVLITYSDEGQGHTGYVYECSGWTRTMRAKRGVYELNDGTRVSPYSNGRMSGRTRTGWTWLQRWEHRACGAGDAADWLLSHGWVREPIPGRRWKSGAQAFRVVRRQPAATQTKLFADPVPCARSDP